MKYSTYFLAFLFLFSCGSAEVSGNEEEGIDSLFVEEVPQEGPKSPRMSTTGLIDSVQIDIDYGSPFVKEREIWGGLVPYNKVWRAGANETTAITFGSDCKFNGQAVSAGTYAFFIIPKETGTWTIILNEEWSKEEHDVWGAYDYKQEKDVLRTEIAVEWMQESMESLSYSVFTGGIRFSWENLMITIPVTAE